jgi:hypothetical protein
MGWFDVSQLANTLIYGFVHKNVQRVALLKAQDPRFVNAWP